MRPLSTTSANPPEETIDAGCIHWFADRASQRLLLSITLGWFRFSLGEPPKLFVDGAQPYERIRFRSLTIMMPAMARRANQAQRHRISLNAFKHPRAIN
jgi:hypothetical protein